MDGTLDFHVCDCVFCYRLRVNAQQSGEKREGQECSLSK
jgi:hypothetical protein